MQCLKVSLIVLASLLVLQVASGDEDQNRRGKVRRVKKLRLQQDGGAGAAAGSGTKPAFRQPAPIRTSNVPVRQQKAIAFEPKQQQPQRIQVQPQQQFFQQQPASFPNGNRAAPGGQQQQFQQQPLLEPSGPPDQQPQQPQAAAPVTSFVPNSIPRAEVKRPQPSQSFASNSQRQPPVPIRSQDFTIDDFGNYQFNFETGDQVQRVENGQQVIRENEKFQAIEGSYSYTGPDGKQYTVRYIADENGFQPIGDHIPRLPKVSRNKQ